MSADLISRFYFSVQKFIKTSKKDPTQLDAIVEIKKLVLRLFLDFYNDFASLFILKKMLHRHVVNESTYLTSSVSETGYKHSYFIQKY